MAKDKTKPQDTDREAIHLAETTDVSPKQAKDLLREHHGDKKKGRREGKELQSRGIGQQSGYVVPPALLRG